MNRLIQRRRVFLTASLLAFAIALGACSSKPTERARHNSEEVHKVVATNVRLAAIYLQRNQIHFAKEKADKALAADPNDSSANNMMGILSWRLKELDKADTYFRKATRLQPGNATASNNYGAFLCDQGDIDRSLKYFDKAAENPLYDNRAQAMTNAGRCLMKKPDPAKAETYFRRALTFNRNENEALLYLAKISFQANRMLTARGFLQRYFDTRNQSAEALYLAVRVESAMGNKRLAIRYARRLKEQFPASPEASRVTIR